MNPIGWVPLQDFKSAEGLPPRERRQRWKTLSPDDLEKLDKGLLSCPNLLQIACFLDTGKPLPLDLAERIARMSGFQRSAVSRLGDMFNFLLRGFRRPSGGELVAALAHRDWNGAQAAVKALRGSEVRCAKEALQFISQGQEAQAAFILVHNSLEDCIKALDEIDKAELLNKAYPLFLEAHPEIKGYLDRRRVALDPENPEGYYELALHYSSVLLDGAIWNREDLLKKVIELDSSRAEAYYYLARIKSLGSVVKLNNGIEMTTRELCSIAIQLKSDYANALYLLARHLGPDETTRMPNRVEMNAEALYGQVLVCDPKHADACFQLSQIASQGQLGHILNAIFNNPNQTAYYYRLIFLLKEGKVFLPHLNKEVDRKDLYQIIIEIDGNDAKAHLELAKKLKKYEEVEIHGKRLDKKNLLSKALKLNPDEAETYYEMACSFDYDSEFCQLPNGEDADKKTLLAKALEIKPTFLHAWCELANLLQKAIFIKTARIHDKNVSMQDCFIRIIALNPRYAKAYEALASTLSGNKTATLEDGTVMTKEQLLERAASLSG